MTKFTHKLLKQVLVPAIQVVMFALVLAGFGAAAALAQTRGYVTNAQDNTVSVIDTTTASVIATVPVGSSPSSVAVTPNGRFAYVTNQFSNTVSVISAASNTVVATVPVPVFPGAIAITPNGAFAYVTSSPDSKISVIDTGTNTVVAAIPIRSPFMLAMAPVGDLLYVTHGSFVKSVTVINTATNTIVTDIPVPADVASDAAVTPDGAFVYVTLLSFTTGSKLAVIDAATNTVVAIVPLPATFAGGLAITPDGAFAYVTNNGGGVCCAGPGPSSISVIDTASNTEVTRMPLPLGFSPFGVAVTPDGAFVYITELSINSVLVIDTATNSPVTIVPVGHFPQSIAFGILTEEPPPPDPLDVLLEQLEGLIADGTLTQDQGAGLLDKIHEAVAKHDAGQTGAACNQLSGFINQVEAFTGNGTLTPAEGQSLIDAANAVKTKFGC